MKIEYCIECSAPLTQNNRSNYSCSNGHDYWNNPRAAVAVVIVNDKKELLFAKRARDPQKDKYDFPGGFVEFGEEAEDAARRELKEEAGIELHQLELIHSVSNSYMEGIAVCDLLFICRSWSGEIVPTDDVAALEWYPLDFMKTDEFAWKYTGAYERLGAKI